MTDDQLLQIAGGGSGLCPEAAQALGEELAARRLKEPDVEQYLNAVSHQQLQIKAGTNVFFRTRGTGIAFRGRRFASEEDERLGIWLCTRWFILCWVPLVPLGSYRIRFDGPLPRFWRRPPSYKVISQQRLDWGTVMRIWGIEAAVILLLSVVLPFLDLAIHRT